MKSKILLLFTALLPLVIFSCKKKTETPPPTPTVFEIPEGTLPVVFHVLYENPGSMIQNPSAAVFEKRIEQMNQFYAASLFTSTGSAKVDVKFMLATHDPDGNEMAEPGIHRVQYSGSSSMSAEKFLDHKRTLSTLDKEILWDPNQYVNIWLFGFLQSSNPDEDETYVTGISYMPYCTSANPLLLLPQWNGALTQLPDYMHGITLNNRYFQPKTNLMNDEGMFTLCHEMGHYLGLYHAFSEENGCDDPDNASDDGCSDTPKYDRATYQQLFETGTLPYDEYYRQPCDGSEPFLSTNVMDYYMSLRTNLTSQQKARVEHVMAYSPWIPRSKSETKAMLENFTDEITDERPTPVLMR